MNFQLKILLETSSAQAQQLRALQAHFAQVCNALTPTVQQTRVWNRVALHHLAYRQLRTQFPALGSQMVCNAIYAVSRTSRLVFQHPDSPFSLERLGDQPLPLLHFADDGPVYFDRHTLSLKTGVLSLYTLEGRMRFEQVLRPEDEALFHAHKLREMVLTGGPEAGFALTLWLEDVAAAQAGDASARKARAEADAAVQALADEVARLEAQMQASALPAAGAAPVPRVGEGAELATAATAVEKGKAGLFADLPPGALPDFVKVRQLS
ncbi:hypothetical protein [Acidovorax sp. SRB_24]|uniref:hypothetical protein n=1 Tax=Acidovorax sp. SRB_24 TaxID=1962700 RepID=UPI001ED4C41C|nr:hypothetical protein [Acidovorax sp. SRB_24]NMM78533.1 hypothetical protein [Acidovorax sp. SRB_24]